MIWKLCFKRLGGRDPARLQLQRRSSFQHFFKYASTVLPRHAHLLQLRNPHYLSRLIMTETVLRSSSSIPAYQDGAMMSNSSPPIPRADSYSAISRSERLLLRIPESNLVTTCGGLAGAASAIVSCPLDVIKTKLQAQGGFSRHRGTGNPGTRQKVYNGIRGTAITIWTEDGVRGLYRGLGPLLLGYIPTWAVFLTVYNRAQQYFNTKTGTILNFCSCVSCG